MSDTVNDYGLGSPDSQPGEAQAHAKGPDPLAHGLGPREVTNDNHGDEDVAEGGRRNKLEHGLAGGALPDDARTPAGEHPDPLRHGLGSPEAAN